MINTYIIVILLLVLIAVIIVIRARGARAHKNGGERSRLEASIIRIFEDITRAKFNQAHPPWLRAQASGAPFELDGYNSDLGIAIEVQGPGHTRPLKTDTAAKYKARIANDRAKRDICLKHGIKFIAIDYRVAPYMRREYIISRLHDVGFIAERPKNYINEFTPEPFKYQ